MATGEMQDDVANSDLDRIVERILVAYEHADLVCLGERHRSKQDSDLRIRLVEHPDFAKTVDVIIIEWANPTRQKTLDRYIAGEDVPIEELRWVWLDATSPGVWIAPIYFEFLQTVRAVNLDLSADERVRVIAGDFPLDWRKIESSRDMPEVMNRGSYPIDVTDEQILSKGHKGLSIFGLRHHERWQGAFTGELERRYPGSTWIVSPISPLRAEAFQKVLELTERPMIIDVAGSLLADQRAVDFLLSSRFDRPEKIGGLVDQFVYFGPEPDIRVGNTSNPLDDPDVAPELQRRRKIFLEWAQQQRPDQAK